MTDVTTYPLQDHYETTLSEAYAGGTGTLYVNALPWFTFPSGVTTYLVVNPWKSTMQVVEVDSYDSGTSTFNVTDATLEKGAGLNYSAQTHAEGSIVRVSNNYVFWKDLVDSVNSKLGNDEDMSRADQTIAGIVANGMTETERDALTPANWMIVLNTTSGVLNQYIGGSWQTFATGTTPNMTTSAAGKGELATNTEAKNGTATGWSWAPLVLSPEDYQKVAVSWLPISFNSATGSDTYTASMQTTLTSYTTRMMLVGTFATANTGACSVNIDGNGAVSIKTKEGNDPESGHIPAWSTHILIHDGTNFVLQTPSGASTTVAGLAKMSTDLIATTWTNETDYINPKQAKDNYETLTNPVTWSRTNGDGSWSENKAHWLSRVPKQLMVFWYADNDTSKPFFGIWQASDDKSIYIANSWQEFSDNFIGYSWACVATVASVDSTNIVLNRTAWTDQVSYTIFCLA